MDKGTKTRQKCANVCKKRPGCVAFDLSPPDSTADKEDVKKVRSDDQINVRFELSEH